jgi:hypothetical protein
MAQIGAGRVPAVADDDRTRRRRVLRDALEPALTAHPVARQPSDLPREVGLHGRDRVVVVRLDPHHARRLGGAEADREDRSERDRHLAEDVARVAHADDARDAVGQLDRLDPALEHREQRALLALVCGVLAGAEAEVRRHARKPLPRTLAESGEERDAREILGRDDATNATRRGCRPLPADACRA